MHSFPSLSSVQLALLFNLGCICWQMGQTEESMAFFWKLSATFEKSETDGIGHNPAVRLFPDFIDGSSTISQRDTLLCCLRVAVATNNVAAMLSCTNKLQWKNNDGSNSDTFLCHIHALLGAEQYRKVQRLCQEPQRDTGDRPTQLCVATYEAEALFAETCHYRRRRHRNSSNNDEYGGQRDFVGTVKDLTDKALAVKTNDNHILATIASNNAGITCLMVQDELGAVRHFRTAVTICQSLDTTDLRPFFNLTLLLWRRANTEEAMNVWLQCRGFAKDLSLGKAANVLLENAVSCYNNAFELAMDTTMTTVPSRVEEVEAVQVYLMDCMMLQCRVQSQNRKILKSLLLDYTKPAGRCPARCHPQSSFRFLFLQVGQRRMVPSGALSVMVCSVVSQIATQEKVRRALQMHFRAPCQA